MRKLLSALLVLTFIASFGVIGPPAVEARAALAPQDEGPRVLTRAGTRRRRWRSERARRRGIRSAFKRAGKSAGRGGKRFGQNVARGRVLRGGKEFGKGMGGFGKHTGKGVARTMRRVFKP
ncbi:MAG TPA: hypothetical protein VN256_04180 [Pyrinomonadaceae bacterium]|nr:hypothetical protein [Pyrinomonadaceae bacterium]